MRSLFKLPRKGAIVWVMLLALMLHGLIPTGYMPDFSGQSWLIICDGTDHISMPAGSDMGHMDHSACHHHHNGPCPFAAGAIYGFESVQAPIIGPPVYFSADEHWPPLHQHAGQRSFSGASSRSPPSFS